jgi:pyruvate kinase
MLSKLSKFTVPLASHARSMAALSPWMQPATSSFNMTKITATIGPSSEQAGPLQSCVDAGMSIMRINFSHATDEECHLRMDNLRVSKGTHERAGISMGGSNHNCR